MAPKTKIAQTKQEASFALEAYELLRKGFELAGADLRPFCSQAQGHVKSIVSVKEGGTLAGETGIRFADGNLYVGRKVFEQYKSNPDGFAKLAVKAVQDGLKERARWDRKYTKTSLEQDLAVLRGLQTQLSNGPLNKPAVPSKTDTGELITLKGPVYVPQKIHQIYQSLVYGKEGVYLNEQAFANAYSEYQTAVKAKDIKPGRFIIADFNLHMSTRRFYLLDFTDPQKPKVVDALTVAHGVSSDPDRDGWVNTLSNEVDSHQSSRGLYCITKAESQSNFGGYVWRLEGRDSTSFRAQQRGILIHNKSQNGRYTWGCFGLDAADAGKLGLPLDGNMAGVPNDKREQNLQSWVGTGVYVYFDRNVQAIYKKD